MAKELRELNWDLAVSLFLVHFLSAATENEPKERRSRGRGSRFQKGNKSHF